MFELVRYSRLPLLLLLILLGCFTPAFAMDLVAYWQYRANGGEELKTQDELQQRYTLLLGPSLGYQPTHALSASANVGYSRTIQDLGRGDGRETVEAITPSATASLTNNIFRASLSGLIAENRPSKGNDFTSRSWDATLSSAWVLPFIPSVNLNYSESEDYTKDDDGPGAFREESKSRGVSVNWDLMLAQLYYDFSQTRQESPFQKSETDTDTHFARLETQGSFWQKKLDFNLAQQYIHSESERTQVLDAEVSSAVTSLISLPNPEDVPNLASNPLLSDANLVDAALVAPDPNDPNNQRVHIGIRLDLREAIGEAYLYFNPQGSLSGQQVADLQWDLYTRPLPGSPWELMGGDIPSDFDAANNRVVLGVNALVREMMVVAVVPVAGPPLTVTEFEVVRQDFSSDSTTSDSYQTSFSLRANLTSTLSAFGSLTYERRDVESGEIETELRRRALNGSISWRPFAFFVPSVSFSETRDRQTAAPDLLNRTYALTVVTNPLPTVSMTLGATRNDNYEDEVKITTTSGYSLAASAQIYPDLNSSLFLNLNETERLDELGIPNTTEAFSARFNLNARLWPTLTADFGANYRSVSQNDEDSGSRTDTTESLHFRPSAFLSARASHSKAWNTDAPDIYSFNMDVGLIRTQKTQLTGRYIYRESGGDALNRFGLTGSWDISRNLSFQTRTDYTFAETDSWRVDADLTLRL